MKSMLNYFKCLFFFSNSCNEAFFNHYIICIYASKKYPMYLNSEIKKANFTVDLRAFSFYVCNFMYALQVSK